MGEERCGDELRAAKTQAYREAAYRIGGWLAHMSLKQTQKTKGPLSGAPTYSTITVYGISYSKIPPTASPVNLARIVTVWVPSGKGVRNTATVT